MPGAGRPSILKSGRHGRPAALSTPALPSSTARSTTSAPRSPVCANSDDAESALEAGAIVRALAQNLASAADAGNPGLLAGQRPVS